MTECEKLIDEGKLNVEFLQSESRDEYMISELMKKVWAIELDLLYQLSKICEKYHLRYWCGFGTLLGAIRHEGFIPWDDDLDIWMPREDYEKFLAVGEAELLKPYFLQTTISDVDYYCPFARIRNSNTTGISSVSKNNKCNNGIYIDIYPLDGTPLNERKTKRRLFVNHTRNVLANAYMYNINPSPLAKLANRFLHLPFIYYNHVRVYNKVNTYAKKYIWSNSTRVGIMAFPWKYSVNLVFEKECFNETIFCKYEYMNLPVPVGYDKILKKLYGDYRIFPPVEKRGCWHDFEFNPDVPYTEYKKDI